MHLALVWPYCNKITHIHIAHNVPSGKNKFMYKQNISRYWHIQVHNAKPFSFMNIKPPIRLNNDT